MNVSNCKSCGRLFNSLSGERICPACQKEMDDKFMQVKEYVLSNKGASVEQVAKENDVTMKQIRQWIKEERLELSDPLLSGITCETCGKPICTGRYCDACKSSMANSLQSAFAKPTAKSPEPKKKTPQGQKMRFLQGD